MQENERASEPCAFIAVKKRVVLGQVKSVSCRHLKQVFVKPFARKSCFGLGDSGLKKPHIPYTRLTPVAGKLV